MGVKRLDNGKYEADYRDAQGNRHRRRFDTKGEAQHYLAEQKQAVKRSTYVNPKVARGTTIADLWATWRPVLASQGARGSGGVSARTLNDYDYWAEMILDDWRHTPLANVSRERVLEWTAALQARRGGPASDRAKARVQARFQAMLDYAAQVGMIERNPLRDRAGRGLPSPRINGKKTHVRLTMSQLVRLAAACGRYSEMVLFTGLTGLRWGEVSTLRARHFDEGGTGEEATIFIDRAVAKTDEERVVPVPEMLAKALASRLALCSPDDLIFPSPMGRVLDDKNFRNRQFNPAARAAAEAVATLARALGVTAGRRRAEYDGRAFPVASFNEPMREALNSWQAEHGLPEVDHTTPALWDSIAAGVADEELAALCRRLRLTHLKPGDVDFLKPEFHDLRRTAVSLALAEGASVKAVQRFVGHSSVTMTLEVYADVVGDQVEGVARALGNSLGRVAGLEEALTSAS